MVLTSIALSFYSLHYIEKWEPCKIPKVNAAITELL